MTVVELVTAHDLIGLDAGGHLCSACGRVPNFPAHVLELATRALTA